MNLGTNADSKCKVRMGKSEEVRVRKGAHRSMSNVQLKAEENSTC